MNTLVIKLSLLTLLTLSLAGCGGGKNKGGGGVGNPDNANTELLGVLEEIEPTQNLEENPLEGEELQQIAQLEDHNGGMDHKIPVRGQGGEDLPNFNNNGFQMPTSGQITSPYGYRKHPVHGGTKLHKGVDIAAYGNPEIQAMGGGKVARSGWFPGYGNGVEIQHPDGTTTFYAHMRDKPKVSVGQQVQKGQPIGVMGNTGTGTGDHLHLEVDRHGQSVDPMILLRETSGNRHLGVGSQI